MALQNTYKQLFSPKLYLDGTLEVETIEQEGVTDADE